MGGGTSGEGEHACLLPATNYKGTNVMHACLYHPTLPPFPISSISIQIINIQEEGKEEWEGTGAAMPGGQA